MKTTLLFAQVKKSSRLGSTSSSRVTKSFSLSRSGQRGDQQLRLGAPSRI